jgi:thioredoxin 1
MKYILSFLMLLFVFTVNVHKNLAEDIYITDIVVAEEQAKETKTKLLLIFSADWCKYCGPLKDSLDKNIDLVNTKYTVCYIDFDDHRDLASKYNIRSIPATIIINDNNTFTKVIGFSNFDRYKNLLGL